MVLSFHIIPIFEQIIKTMRLQIPFLFALSPIILLCGCGLSSPQVPQVDPKGTVFPGIKGTSLEGKLTHMPEDYAGKPVVLIIGYLQKSQFDIDRWIYGILENNIGIRVVEVPTLPGLVPGMISNIIDNGMRGGIPKEDWGGVVTVYDDASKIVDAIGNDNPQNGHVVLLGSDGRILWLHDRGFSPRILLDLKKRIAELPPGA